MKQVLQLQPWAYMLAFVMFQVCGSLLLRVSSQRTGAAAVGWFVFGNGVGFCGATCLTLALRTEHPNLTFALCQGVAFCVLQLASYWVFQIPLRPAQWVGIAFIAAGVVCVQLNGVVGKPHPQSAPQAQ